MEQVANRALAAYETQQPERHTPMKLVRLNSKREERIDVEQIPHGKSLSSSATISLVKMGALAPALRTGIPVIGSVTIRAFLWRFLWESG